MNKRRFMWNYDDNHWKEVFVIDFFKYNIIPRHVTVSMIKL